MWNSYSTFWFFFSKKKTKSRIATEIHFLRCDWNNFGSYGKVLVRAFQNIQKIKQRLSHRWENRLWVRDLGKFRAKNQWKFTAKSWFYVIFFVYEFHIVFKVFGQGLDNLEIDPKSVRCCLLLLRTVNHFFCEPDFGLMKSAKRSINRRKKRSKKWYCIDIVIDRVQKVLRFTVYTFAGGATCPAGSF